MHINEANEHSRWHFYRSISQQEATSAQHGNFHNILGIYDFFFYNMIHVHEPFLL